MGLNLSLMKRLANCSMYISQRFDVLIVIKNVTFLECTKLGANGAVGFNGNVNRRQSFLFKLKATTLFLNKLDYRSSKFKAIQ